MAEKENRDERSWAMCCHLSALAMYIGIPFGNIIGPLIVWLIKRDEFAQVDVHGKESLNFQISMTIYMIIAGLMIIVVIGIALLPLLFVVDLILIVIASIKASEGEVYRYPFSIQFLR